MNWQVNFLLDEEVVVLVELQVEEQLAYPRRDWRRGSGGGATQAPTKKKMKAEFQKIFKVFEESLSSFSS